MFATSLKSFGIVTIYTVFGLAGAISPGSAQEVASVSADAHGGRILSASAETFSSNAVAPSDLEASWRKMPIRFLHQEPDISIFPADTFQTFSDGSLGSAGWALTTVAGHSKALDLSESGGTGGLPQQSQGSRRHGLVMRSVSRILEDQKELYLTPFKPANFKWDALELGGTAALIAADRHIETHISHAHEMLYQNASDAAIGGLGAALTGVWIWGLKGDHPHAKETGVLELETLVNTFLIYTPMQFLAARQRPDEGNGNGDFWKHHNINTSFPGGHAMFTFAMSTVVSHEYSQWWVQALAYGAASVVTVTRFAARDHWSSDMFVGAALGIGIGSHVFHAHCNPELSDSCKSHKRWIF